MKTAIIFHSHYGNTTHVVNSFEAALSSQSQVDVFELRYKGGRKNIVIRMLYRIFPYFVQLMPVKVDLAEYDIVFFGVAVMGGHPSSAMARYLNVCKNITGKHVICCYVYSIEASMRGCKQYVSDIMTAKGVKNPINLEVSWNNVLNKTFIETIISQTKKKVFPGC
jgi:menaquinone-dependent protoporphyrinogen IX oxidase